MKAIVNFDLESELKAHLNYFIQSNNLAVDFLLKQDPQMDQDFAVSEKSWIARATPKAVPEWISVDDRIPEDNILVLAMSQTVSNIFNVYNVMALDEFKESHITHWMPLPDAPQEQSHEK